MSASISLAEQPRSSTSSNQAPPAWPEELGSIYSAHYRYVLRVCRKFFPQRQDAEDAAAEVFLKLHRVLAKRQPAMEFQPWLAQVARRHCIDKLRERKRENRCYFPRIEGEISDDSTLSPLSQFLHKERRLQVRAQLNRLPKHYRVPLVLRYYRKMSYSEIAIALGRRLPAIRMTIFRAKDQLRRNLAPLANPHAVAEPQRISCGLGVHSFAH